MAVKAQWLGSSFQGFENNSLEQLLINPCNASRLSFCKSDSYHSLVKSGRTQRHQRHLYRSHCRSTFSNSSTHLQLGNDAVKNLRCLNTSKLKVHDFLGRSSCCSCGCTCDWQVFRSELEDYKKEGRMVGFSGGSEACMFGIFLGSNLHI